MLSTSPIILPVKRNRKVCIASYGLYQYCRTNSFKGSIVPHTHKHTLTAQHTSIIWDIGTQPFTCYFPFSINNSSFLLSISQEFLPQFVICLLQLTSIHACILHAPLRSKPKASAHPHIHKYTHTLDLLLKIGNSQSKFKLIFTKNS